jgi:hypothetical protein
MAIEFVSSEFILSHRRSPRGHGRWGFAEDRNAVDQSRIFWAQGTLTEAKAKIRAQLKADGVTSGVLYILP